MVRKGEERKRRESERLGTLGHLKGDGTKQMRQEKNPVRSTVAPEDRGRSVGPTEMGWN